MNRLTGAALLALACAVTGCGGGGGGGGTTTSGGSTGGSSGTGSTSTPQMGSAGLGTGSVSVSPTAAPATDADAYRFLNQATFGPTAQDVAHLKAIGYSQWIDEQFDMHLRVSHLKTVTDSAAAMGMSKPEGGHLTNSWWTHALEDPAQLRQRVAFALSEIFVISTLTVDNGATAASYLDMLTEKGSGSFRDLLEAVTLHPAMGEYLSHLGNRKEDLASGRVPDENFAREVMQLFTIGLYELDDGGNPKLLNNVPQETYSATDISGLAKVFTGFSWSLPAGKSLDDYQCFWRTSQCNDSSQDIGVMTSYPSFHSTSAKQFLGVTVPEQSSPNPNASLKAALDRLATHQNTAPFISKQLIQKLVTSNPSSAYVSDITAVFRASNGNLRTVVKAILLHKEARFVDAASASSYGKLREPVLRFAQLFRTLPHSSKTYSDKVTAGVTPFYQVVDTMDPGSALGQAPLRSPSVFNFFRPGYRPPQTALPANMVAPEMQITNETSMLGYANYVANALSGGWGRWLSAQSAFDVQFDFSQWDSVANTPSTLVTTMAQTLLGHPLASDVQAEAVEAVAAMPSSTPRQRRDRVQAAILLVAVSPEYLVQQ